MLETVKSITITGQSKIEGQLVATMTATISTEGSNSYSNQNIVDDVLYKANRVAVRADMAAFGDEVFAVEDQLATDKKMVNK